jgi:hypothetical protein
LVGERLTMARTTQTFAGRTASVCSSFAGVSPIVGLGLGTVAIGFGLLASLGHGLLVIALCLICGALAWAGPKPAALSATMLGVMLLPTPAMNLEEFHGIPLSTILGIATLCATLALWWHRNAVGARHPTVSSCALASWLLLVVASVVQLGISKYADPRPILQVSTFWLAGLLLGSLLASDHRTLDGLRLLALTLASFAVIEFVLGRPNLWGNVVGANEYASIAAFGGHLRATSTFGHPLVAGAALIVLAFLVLLPRGRKSSILFALIVAGAVVTVSRSALVGLAAGLLAHFASGQHRRAAILGATVVTIAISWLMITLLPTLSISFASRVLGAPLQGESIRLNSLHILAGGLSQGNAELMLGRGIGGSISYLAQTGGNLGFSTYDNQYITSIYDSGLLVVLSGIGLIVLAIARRRPGWTTLAPLSASAATMFFFEGLYWPVTGLLFWMTVGLATAPNVPAVTSATPLTVPRGVEHPSVAV